MGLNPLETSKHIFDRYKRYISTSLKFNDEDLNNQLKELLEETYRFSKGPIIEATPSYKTGRTIIDLIGEGVLTSEFRNFKSPALPLERNLYMHQEKAIRKVCKENKNIIVATGTGSGKTESFIIPILNELIKEKENEELTPGVRALLLYPMNALANDQMKRLRSLLENEPEITFGIYTGETENDYDKALDKFLRMHGKRPIQNELISRDKMKETPPHILLTNYAMLEYLMLRPEDSVFFEGEHSNSWKFIVIDEAHTYTGAKGIEMSMLLARLKSTIGVTKGSLRCILTSASLGSGKEDLPKVANFGQKLFQEDFQSKDVIEAVKDTLRTGEVWGTVDPIMYKELVEILTNSPDGDVRVILENYGVPKDIITKSLKEEIQFDRRVVYDSLIGDERVNRTIKALSDGPMDFFILANEIFKDDIDAEYKMTTLIDLCNIVRRSKDENPLIPARYHFLVKALEGAYVAFSDTNKLYLNRMKTALINDKEVKAFEVGTCSKCNSIYLVGEIEEDRSNGLSYLVENQNRYSEESKELEFYAITPDDYNYIENEDDLIDEGMHFINQETFLLCPICGNIRREGDPNSCSCDKSKQIRVVKTKGDDGSIHKCSICGAQSTRGSVVRRFFLSEDVVSSVLATALYDHIPNKVKEIPENNEASGLFAAAKRKREQDVTKQLLVFSDSRQNAAYFASYLKNSHKDLLIRNILVKVINENKEAFENNSWSLDDFQRRVKTFVTDRRILKGSKETLEVETWKWLTREFFDKGNNSLESTGYIKFLPDYDSVDDMDIVFELNQFKELGLDTDNAKRLVTYFIDDFRYSRAFKYPEIVDPKDDYFSPQNTQGGFCRVNPPSKNKFSRGYTIKSWKPSANHLNGRLDYLMKLVEANGKDYSKDELVDVLDMLYEIFTSPESPLYDYVLTENNETYGVINKLDTKLFKVVPGLGNKEVEYYKCDKCHNITTINISDVCPTYRCSGKLKKINMEKRLINNHYRDLYSQLKLEKMDVSEHTAQLKTEYAAEVQNKFINGEINVLSCSTTFELGVDVGELETVFMKNVPPTPANYAQRAGRAGRRTDSTAYALTFARLSSHDFSSFLDPSKMISGVVKPPYFEIANEKIAKRHIYACAFSKFWRNHSDYFQTVSDFFVNKEIQGPQLLKEYLDSRPVSLGDMIKDVIPESLHEEVGVENWIWASELYSEDGTMTKIVSELKSDIESLNASIEDAIKREGFREAAEYKRIINTIESKNLIGFLSQKNALPKYGFPVDVVSMEINSHVDEGRNIELSRDLQIAISEYAPESQVVANGKLWTGRYVKKVRNRELLRYSYESCKCGYFKKQLITGSAEANNSCPVCGNRRFNTGVYMTPEFGFITEKRVENPGPKRPRKTYSSRKHFSGMGRILDTKKIQVGNNIIELKSMNHGQLSVLNNGNGRGFFICKTCGYGTIENLPKSHVNSDNKQCKGSFERLTLGYDFETDILEINFTNIFQGLKIDEGFWESIMYAIIEGVSLALEIDRSDIDGTLHVNSGDNKSLILFDTVPGGAGHVKRLMDEVQFKTALRKALDIVENCDCGGENKDTSCYSCLRNYHNQYCHEKMQRRFAIDGLRMIQSSNF